MTLPAGVPPGAGRRGYLANGPRQGRPPGLAAMHDRRGGIGLDSTSKAVFGIARLPLLPPAFAAPNHRPRPPPVPPTISRSQEDLL